MTRTRTPRGLRPAASEWTPDRAALAARALGIPRLTHRHWNVIARYREEAARTGCAPGLATLQRLTDLGRDELATLFPGDAEVSIARIAGFVAPPKDVAIAPGRAVRRTHP